jgi:uncharacterized repeat protein (TIGR01451 family)
VSEPAQPAAGFVPMRVPVAAKPAPTEPERTPAFRPVRPESEEESSSLRPHIPEQVVPTPPAALPPPGVQTPVIALDKTGPEVVRAGEPFSYEIVVRNVGMAPALRLVLVDELPAGTHVLAAEPQPFVQDNRLAWQLEGLDPGTEKRFQVRVLPAAGADWRGTATVMVSASRELHARVRGAPPAPVTEPAAAPEPLTCPVLLNLRGPGTFVVQGHPVTFELHVTNKGATPLVGLLLHTHLPPGLEHFYGSDIELNLDPLGPGDSRTEKLEVIATHTGHHVADVSVRAHGMAPVVARAEATVRNDPVLGLRLVGPREAWVGRETEYRLEVANRSPTDVSNVVVVERLPAGVSLVGGVFGGGYDAASRTLRWHVGRLAPGQVRTLALKLVTQATGPALHDITARTAQGHEARLQTVLKCWPPRPARGSER